MKNANILVPIDFSSLSFKALEAADTISGLFDGAITPFHTYMPTHERDDLNPASSKTLTDSHKVLEEKLRKKLDEAASKWVAKNHLNSGVVQIGNPSETIIETAQNFDMIVMTTHGRTGFSRLIMGSVAEKVIRFAPVPVLVVEEASKISPLNKILLTTDFSENSSKAIPFAKSIATASGASLDIIHIVSFEQFGSIPQIQSAIDTRKKQMRELVDKRFDDIRGQVKTDIISTNKSIHEKITKLSQKEGYNLIIMATIGRTGLEYLRLGSTASNVIRHVESAVFTINPQRLKGAVAKKSE